MSTHWFPYCKTCKTDEHRVLWWNHGNKGVHELLPLMPALGRFARELSATALDVEIRISGPEWTNGLLEFAAKHGDHELVVMNEYGQLDTQCQAYWLCNGGHSHKCDLDDKHEGPHGPKAGQSTEVLIALTRKGLL